jgi:hypothetical protein
MRPCSPLLQAQYDPAIRARMSGGDHIFETRGARVFRDALCK